VGWSCFHSSAAQQTRDQPQQRVLEGPYYYIFIKLQCRILGDWTTIPLDKAVVLVVTVRAQGVGLPVTDWDVYVLFGKVVGLVGIGAVELHRALGTKHVIRLHHLLDELRHVHILLDVPEAWLQIVRHLIYNKYF